ncbi:MAG: HypC/HybG/HupF family hydrogenase formation chaperone [Nitrospirota bacterium]|jgi:hydrogenase expression/formation protein HypC
MCLAIPSEVVEIEDLMATVDVMGARRAVNLVLMPEEVALGDFVLVHAGFAIQKVDQGAAEDALALLKEVVQKLEQEGAFEEDEDWDALPPPPGFPSL